MEMVVDHQTKIVEYWLRSDEAGLREQLKPEFMDWRRKGYMPAVFLSGDGDLYSYTRDLLRYNRKRIAELEVQQTKAVI